MLAKLLEHDHGQEARAGPSPGDGMERRRRLADFLAIAAGELLPDRLDHLPLARHQFQRPRHVLAELAKAIAAAAFTSRRSFDHHPLPGKVLREGLALSALERKSAHRRRLRHGSFRRKLVLGGVGFQLFERQRQLLDHPRPIHAGQKRGQLGGIHPHHAGHDGRPFEAAAIPDDIFTRSARFARKTTATPSSGHGPASPSPTAPSPPHPSCYVVHHIMKSVFSSAARPRRCS